MNTRRDLPGPAYNPLLVSAGPTHLVVITADGTRGYGSLDRYHPAALRDLDMWLDSLDAANEGPDGRIAA